MFQETGEIVDHLYLFFNKECILVDAKFSTSIIL